MLMQPDIQPALVPLPPRLSADWTSIGRLPYSDGGFGFVRSTAFDGLLFIAYVRLSV